MNVSGRGTSRAPRFGIVLWLTALLLAALEVRPLNTPEIRPAASPGARATP